MYGLIGAMNIEIEGLIAHLEDRAERQIGMDTFTTGKLFGCDAVLAVCGPGKVNAALCAQSMITAFHPEWIINLGVAGAGQDGLSIGDIVIATAAVQHDMDTSPIGDPVGLISKLNLIELPCDAALRARIREAAGTLDGVRVHEGIVATGDQFINSFEKRTAIHERFNAVAVEMEGGAVAHTCYAMGVPCAVVRSISDSADGKSHMDYAAFTKLAASHSVALVEELLRRLA